MFDAYMPALYIGLVSFSVVAVIAALFTWPINRAMEKVEKEACGHNVAH